jgi:aminoglycoside phosphotransferase (APT) family kinase protein
MSLETLDRDWIERVAGGTIERLEPMAGGGSREMFELDVATPDGLRELVVRTETGGGPYAATDLVALSREATVYRALAGRDLATPGLFGLSDDGQALVASRLPGSNDYRNIADPDEQQSVHDSYIEHLAHVHDQDLAELDLDLPAPVVANHARAWLATWDELFRTQVRRPAPLLRFAIRWLGEHAPDNLDRGVLCHGDVGPGNFLHENGRVTGMLDWELCHVGDPHDDLGMLALRAHQLNGFGDLNADLALYEKLRGVELDRSRVRHYRAVALVLAVTTSTMQLDSEATARVQVPLFLHLVPVLQLLMAQSLAELVGVELPTVEDPLGVDDVEGLEGLAALRDEIAQMPVVESSLLGAGPNELVMHAEAALRLGEAVRQVEIEAAGKLLDIRGDTHASVVSAVDAAVADGSADAEAFLEWAWRSARGRRLLWPAWVPVADVPLIPIED